VRTSSAVVIVIVQDLDRALVEAPSLRLRRAAASADWDAALEELVADPTDPDRALDDAGVGAPEDPTGEDPEVRRFRALHRKLHEAVRAVLAVSDGTNVLLV
jgi:hypothetical protein